MMREDVIIQESIARQSKRANRSRSRVLALVMILQAFASGCAPPERLAAVPEDRTTTAEVPGVPNVRYWPDIDPKPFINEAVESVQREKDFLARSGFNGPLPPAYFLAISGGGDNGAFGAGLLLGWTAAGNRPTFKGVTGISTGALIAPFAFLGSDYDQALREVYTNVSKKDIFNERDITAALFDDAMADTEPLSKLVERQVTPDLLNKIGAEYQKGRLLLVATTDLDAHHTVIWNMTKIAAIGNPAALTLFRKVLVASAAIPGVFPPVMIDVENAGKHYQEMHVDGGAMAQVFLYPPALRVSELAATHNLERERTLYVIRNARLDVAWESVERRTLDIASRSITSLIHTQGIGDLYRIYLTAQRDGIDYNLAYIPAEFDVEHKEEFDTNYMRQLFNLGFDMARHGYPWEKHPPGYCRDDVSARACHESQPAKG
jgi:hypothetical protein